MSLCLMTLYTVVEKATMVLSVGYVKPNEPNELLDTLHLFFS